MQQHFFGRPRLILAAVVFGAAAFWARAPAGQPPAKAGFPNPPWPPSTNGNGDLMGNVKRHRTVPSA